MAGLLLVQVTEGAKLASTCWPGHAAILEGTETVGMGSTVSVNVVAGPVQVPSVADTEKVLVTVLMTELAVNAIGLALPAGSPPTDAELLFVQETIAAGLVESGTLTAPPEHTV